MTLEEIKPGMIFKENDSRFIRYIRIARVEGEKIFFIASSNQEFPLANIRREYVSKKPGRFYKVPRRNGYTLVKNTEAG